MIDVISDVTINDRLRDLELGGDDSSANDKHKDMCRAQRQHTTGLLQQNTRSLNALIDQIATNSTAGYCR